MIKTDFIEFFNDAFKARRLRNPKYSMRAFARDLKLSPSRLHHILEGKIGLSLAAAEDIADILSLAAEDRELFLALVDSKHARAKFQKNLAHARLKSLTEPTYSEIDSERFSLIKHWYHAATLALVEIPDFSMDPAWLSKRLNISEDCAAATLNDLVRYGFISQEREKWVKSENVLSFKADSFNTDIKDYNRQLLGKASESITGVPTDERDLSASVVSIRQSDLDFAKEEIAKFRKQLSKKLIERAVPADRVYCLSLQLFPLDRIQNENAPQS